MLETSRESRRAERRFRHDSEKGVTKAFGGQKREWIAKHPEGAHGKSRVFADRCVGNAGMDTDYARGWPASTSKLTKSRSLSTGGAFLARWIFVAKIASRALRSN